MSARSRLLTRGVGVLSLWIAATVVVVVGVVILAVAFGHWDLVARLLGVGTHD